MSACPSADALERLIKGQLDLVEGACVEEHVERCPTCQHALEELTDTPSRAKRHTETGGGSTGNHRDLDRLIDSRPAFVRRDPDREAVGPADRWRAGASELPSIAGFEIIREVGRGGMAIVYEAIELALGRRIALKVVPPLSAGPSTAARFRREARAAGRLHHTNIVPIFGVGSDGDLLYCAMQFIEGEGLDRLIDRLRRGRAALESLHQTTEPDVLGTGAAVQSKALTAAAPPVSGSAPKAPSSGASSIAHARTVARIGRQVAEALQYAHNSGFLHRDIKPSNILLDLAGTALVADFGLAKSAEPEAALTQTGDIVGTLRYLPPERFDGHSDARGDVYALGATLYELLILQPAFDDTDRTRLIERVIQSEPVPPRQLDRRVPRDLETIILKAMSKESGRRYGTAGEMAEDLRRFLENEPIAARRVTVRERVVRWARRRPEQAALAGLLVAVTVVGFSAITMLWLVAASARDRSRAADSEARLRGGAERRARYRAAIAAAASALELNNFDAARALLESAPEEHRNWEWRYFAGQLDDIRTAFLPADGPVSVFALAPDGRRIAYAVAGGRDVRVRAPGSAVDLIVLRGHKADVLVITFSADGSRLAAGSSDGAIRVWDSKSGRPIALLASHPSDLLHLSFGRDATQLLSIAADTNGNTVGYRDGRAQVWDVESGRQRAQFPGFDAAISPDGRTVAAWTSWRVHLRDAATGAELRNLSVPGPIVKSVAFSPDGTRVATGVQYPDNKVYLWNVSKGGPPVVLAGHTNNVHWLAFSPDGRVLASASDDQTVRLWDPSTGGARGVLRRQRSKLRAASFTPDGQRLVTAAGDLTAFVWDAVTGELLGSLRCRTRMRSEPQLSRDGSSLATVEEDGALCLWDVDASTRRGALRGHTSYVYDVAIGPDGRTVASAAWDGTVCIWDADTGRSLAEFRHSNLIVTAVALSPDGRSVASVARDRRVRVWDLAAGTLSRSLELDTRHNLDVDGRVAFSPRGDLLAITGGGDGLVRLHDAATGTLAGKLAGHEVDVTDVAFSPDGSRLASADHVGIVRIWDVAARAPLATIRGHNGPVNRLAFSPDGRAIASASSDWTVRIRDPATAREIAVLKHGGSVYGVAFHPDGSRLAAACVDHTIRLWDMATYEEVAELYGHEAYVHAVVFSPDGTRLVSGSGDYTVRVWDAPSASSKGGAGAPAKP